MNRIFAVVMSLEDTFFTTTFEKAPGLFIIGLLVWLTWWASRKLLTYDTRLKNVESRLDRVESRLDRIEAQLIDINQKLTTITTALLVAGIITLPPTPNFPPKPA